MSREITIGPYSAYAIAVKYGYKGTEQQWIAEQEASRLAAAQSAADASTAATRAENAQKAAETAKGDALDAIGSAKTAAVTAVTDTKTESTKAVQAAQDTATKAVSAAQTDAVSAVEKAGSEVLESIPEDYQTTVKKVEELKTEKAEIDDTTVGADAWSSKHIVDVLCPPISETGNPVQCYPVAGYPLDCKVNWEPAQEGSGDQSPDNVRPIKGRNSVTVERCGENLLNITPFAKKTNKGITYEYVANGGIHISGTATAAVDSPTFAVWRLPPGKYYGLDMGTGISTSIVARRNGANLWINAKGVFEILAGDVIKYWYMIVTNGATLDKTVYPYIVPGSTAPTAYAPYTGQTVTLTLPHTIYGGTVDVMSSEGQEAWKFVTLDGTTNKFSVAATYWNLPRNSAIGIGNWHLQNIHSSHFPSVFGGNARENFIFTTTTLMSKYFQNADALNAYLAAQYTAGTPVQIVYKLAKPVPITVTGAQPIPALSGVNTVLTDADNVTVTGRADPIKRITDLEDAVASMT